MLRKLKHVINKENNGQIITTNVLSPPSTFDLNNGGGAASIGMTTPVHFVNAGRSETPVNYIKRKLKSTKSWAKLGKYPRFFREDIDANDNCAHPTYESMPTTELVNHEFESYLRKALDQKKVTPTSSNSNNYVDYGFESCCDFDSLSSSVVPKHLIKQQLQSQQQQQQQSQQKVSGPTETYSVINKNKHTTQTNNNVSSSLQRVLASKENQLYFDILEKLAGCSLLDPGYVPLLCIRSFTPNDYEWAQLLVRLSLTNKQDEFELIQLKKGTPLNALFYLPCFDLIYVRTADVLEGYLPRSHCQVVSNRLDDTTDRVFNKDKSLKESLVEYDSLSFIDHAATGQFTNKTSTNNLFRPISPRMPDQVKDDSSMGKRLSIDNSAGNKRLSNSFKKPAPPPPRIVTPLEDSSNFVVVQNYEDFAQINFDRNEEIENDQLSPKNLRRLSNLQSRSRIPISIRTDLNLTLMDEQAKHMNNIDQRSEVIGALNLISSQADKESTTYYKKNSNMQKDKNARRSLDPSNMYSKISSVPISTESEVDYRVHDHSEVFYSQAEQNTNTSSKIWTVITEYKAKNPRELSVCPGMLVLIIRPPQNDWLYVKLVQSESDNEQSNQSHIRSGLQQQYGYIPRDCALDLQDVISKSKNNLARRENEQNLCQLAMRHKNDEQAIEREQEIIYL